MSKSYPTAESKFISLCRFAPATPSWCPAERRFWLKAGSDKPGAFKMSPGLTVSGAVAAAGGVLFAADTSTVTVIRSNRDGKKISLAARLENFKAGEMADIGLQGGDIVQLSSSTAKLVPYGIDHFFKEIMRNRSRSQYLLMGDLSPDLYPGAPASHSEHKPVALLNEPAGEEGTLEPGFWDFWWVIRNRRGLIVIFFLAVVITVAVGTLLTTPIYTSQATLLIQEKLPTTS